VLDLGAGLGKGFALFGLLVVGDEHVIAVLTLDRVGDLALGQRKNGLFEAERPHAALDPAQLAASAGRAGILGFLARQLGELGRLGAGALGQSLGLGLCLTIDVLGGAGGQLDQD